MTHRELLISQAETFHFSKREASRARVESKTGEHISPSNPLDYSTAELMADFVIDRFNAFFDDVRMSNNDEEFE